MKKLFVLFLLVALVPFTVGCSLWGHDEDLDVLNTTKASITTKLPASAISGSSLRGAVSYQTLTLTVDGIPFYPEAPQGPDANNLWTIVFSAWLTDAQQATLADASPETAVITTNVSGTPATIITFPVTIVSVTTTPVLVVAEDGTVTVDGTTVPATDVTEGTFDGTTYSFSVASATFNAVDLPTSLTAVAEANYVNTLTPTFTLTFSKAPTNLLTATWKVVVTSVDATTGATIKSYTLDSTVAADKALFTVAAVEGDTTKATVKLNASTTDLTKNLESGKTYKVQVSTNNLTAGTNIYLDTPVAYFFKVVVP